MVAHTLGPAPQRPCAEMHDGRAPRTQSAMRCLAWDPGTGVKWQCRLEMALSGGPWVMLRAGGPGPAAYDVRGRFAAGAPHADFGLASRALTLQDVASACHKCARVASGPLP